MDAFELLKSDHEKVSGIFSKLEETSEQAVKTREELFARLSEELTIHALIEETILYPVLRREAETREITIEGLEEHHVMKLLLRELAEMQVGTEQWTAKMKVLKENVEHHVEEEEGEMFVQAREVLGDEQLKEIGLELQEGKSAARQQAQAARQ
ncbi:MAG TPA: hemerythrin domain-containing protein [Pyrinomonadaceae bacterium]|nr:hemerythrin domain-containing protein [Pyrinomonadaceae bacterium]